MTNTKKATPRNIIFELPKIKDKEKIVKATQRKNTLHMEEEQYEKWLISYQKQYRPGDNEMTSLQYCIIKQK